MTRVVVLRLTQVALDLAILSMALWLACFLRFEGEIPQQVLKRIVFLWPYVIGLQYALLVVVGVRRYAWRYVGLREAVRIFLAIGVGSALLASIRVTVVALSQERGYAQYAYLPLGVIAIDFVLAFLGIAGVRVLRRLTAEQVQVRKRRVPATRATRTLLVGAGQAGLMVAKEIANRPELGVLPVGFIDDDPVKLGSAIHGLEVLGNIEQVQRIARRVGATQAIITIAEAPGPVIRNISDQCRRAGLKVKVIPGLFELVGGRLNLTRLRDVAIEDLLRREPVVLDDAAIAGELRGKVALVTGAGGSIGSELCRQICRFQPETLVLLERSENALFEIHRELQSAFPSVPVRPCVGDVCDAERLREIFEQYLPEVVFHAAAHKHVPMMEWNPGEAVKNNVLGTVTLADTALAHGTRVFVMISTDKAVNPSSIMGASKRAAEVYVQALAVATRTRFVTVRFGNVLGSNGSVVPIFREQIARGGPVTVTHPEMKRYFMTIPEACQLVLQASAMGEGGEIFILDMGEPVKIVDLARDLIQLSGFRPDEIEIAFTGVRPGEKLYEELSVAEESAEKTRHPKVYIGKTTAQPLEAVRQQIERLRLSARSKDASRLLSGLQEIVPEYRPTASSRGGRDRQQEEPESKASLVAPVSVSGTS